MTRLIRGLGSSRAHSRQGFFITLTELLKQAEPGKQLQEMLVIAAKAMEDNLQQKGTKAVIYEMCY